jgi:hypothetical protein
MLESRRILTHHREAYNAPARETDSSNVAKKPAPKKRPRLAARPFSVKCPKERN